MSSLIDIWLEASSLEHLTAIPSASREVQTMVRRLQSNPGLMITLAVPTETAGVRALDLVGHLLVDFGIPFATDATRLIRLANGSCFYVAVDVNLRSHRPITDPDENSDDLAATASQGARP